MGTEAPSRESLSADLELLHLLLPSAIIHSRRTPREADDGCLACGPLTLETVVKKKWLLMTLLLQNMIENVKAINLPRR